jgi:subtilisin family serine protease
MKKRGATCTILTVPVGTNKLLYAIWALFVFLSSLVCPARAEESDCQLKMPTSLPIARAVSGPQSEPDILLAMPAGGVDDDDVKAAIKDANGSIVGMIGKGPLRIFKVKIEAGKMQEAEGKLSRAKIFAVVQRNYLYNAQAVNQKLVCVNDPYFSQQWNMGATNIPRAWNLSKGANTVLGILDTGCASGLPELAGKTYAGWDAVGHTAYQNDIDGHGTMVATTAAANTGNWIGTASPARMSYVYPVRVGLYKNTITEAALLEGIYISGMQGVKILNISFNMPPPYSLANKSAHPALHTYLQWYTAFTGGIVFNASGNYGIRDKSPQVPYLIVVSAIDRTFGLAPFSNFGNSMWFTCPGVDIFCTHRSNQVVSMDGTSFAAPQCAAIAAMVWSARPSLTRSQVLDIMKQTAVRPMCTPLWTEYYGFGLPNAEAAVRRALGR